MTVCYGDMCVRQSQVFEYVEACKGKCLTAVEDADSG